MLLLLQLAFAALQLRGADSLTIRFIGNEAVALSDGRQVLVFDFPYQGGYSGYMTYPDSAMRLGDRVTAIITHRHRDHFAEEKFLPTSWRIVGPREVTRSLPPARVIPLDSVVRIGDATLRPVATEHAGVEHYAYVLEWKGKRFFFSGDTDDATALLGAGPIDYAFVSSWYLQAVRRSGREATARKVVLYHHRQGESPPCPGCIVPRQGALVE